MMAQTMKKTSLLALISLLGGCALISPSGEVTAQHTPTPLNKASPHRVTIIPAPPEPAIALLAKRQAWCLLPEPERIQVDAVLRAKSNNSSLFQRLMLTSCAPEKYTEQSQDLIQALDLEKLSEAERALLALIDTANRDLLHTQQQRDTLRTKLRETIDGISNIETKINSSETQQQRGQQ